MANHNLASNVYEALYVLSAMRRMLDQKRLSHSLVIIAFARIVILATYRTRSSRSLFSTWSAEIFYALLIFRNSNEAEAKSIQCMAADCSIVMDERTVELLVDDATMER